MRYLFVVAVCIGIASPALAQEIAKNDATTLDISATVDVKAAPDIATVSAGVMTMAKTAEAAMKENSVKMNAMFAALKTAGIADKDRQTSGININPQYVYEQNKTPQITGYQASNNVNVIIRDLKNIGPVLDALIAQGANQLNGPNFTLDNPEDLLDGARKDAMVKARKRAELYATAAGMKIKRIRTISESSNTGNPPPYPMMAMRKEAMASAAVAPMPVAAGEINMAATVNVTFELE